MDGNGFGTAHEVSKNALANQCVLRFPTVTDYLSFVKIMQWWGLALVLLYGVQCAVGFWAQRTPASDRTSLHRTLLAGLGVCIVLLAFYDAWLGFVAAGDSPLLWYILFVVSSYKELFPQLVDLEIGRMLIAGFR
jgi:Na+/proline symporter